MGRLVVLFAIGLLLPRAALAQVAQPGTLISSGGVRSSAGSLTISSNVGDVMVGQSTSGPQSVWHGFYAPQPVALVGVDGPVVTFVSYLAPPSPNPALRSVAIRFGVSMQEPLLSLGIYDVSGRLVRSVYEGPQTAGAFRIDWDLRSDHGQAVGPGIYFVRIRTHSFTQTARLVVLP